MIFEPKAGGRTVAVVSVDCEPKTKAIVPVELYPGRIGADEVPDESVKNARPSVIMEQMEPEIDAEREI